MKIGNRIKYIRTRSKLSLSDLGRGIVSATHLSNIERGRFNPSDEILASLSERLNVRLGYLTNYNKFDSEIQDLLVNLLDSLILGSPDAKLTVDKLSQKPINNILQETIFLMLISCYKYKCKLNPIEEENQLSFYEIDKISSLDPLLIKSFYYYKGQKHFYKGNYNNSLRYFNELIKLTYSSKEYSFLLYNLALLEYYSKFYIRAAKSAEKALSYSLSAHNWEVSFDIYNLLMVIHWEDKDLEIAKEYGSKALEIGEIKNYSECHRVYHNLGSIHLEEGSLDLAVDFLNKSISLKNKMSIYNFSSKFKLLKCFFLKGADERFKSLHYDLLNNTKTKKEELILEYFNVVFLKRGNTGDIVKRIKEIIPLLKKHNLKEEYISCLKELAVHYSAQNSYKHAFSCYEKLSLALEADVI
ncbi:helix-turn-helix transcriptional regulator [Mesobacillus sp. S13]|uniref:helix-turn-helix transcriptional regulator n=1 Tax=Mesobacillus sp. S13 TaxID=2880221 RepID=UPI001CF2FD7F|nr:helix-turn-helix transcriptional regulator [Mesobacillus sp. S13]